jgi:BMFP domain-containing protein YqiC
MGGPCSTTDDEYIAALTAERDAAIRERQKLEARLSRVLKSSDSMWSQILVVGAERDKLRARVAELEGCSWVPKAELDALQARVAELEAASGGNPPETPDGSSQAAKPELPTD